jgi:trimethylamine--corrinoid protein Co-methyltransferase
LIHYSEPTPPLTHSYGAVNKLFLCAEKGVPLCYAPAAMHGGSAPVTLAGGLVQTNAEALSGIVLHQLKRKGAPVISGLALPVMDMQTFAISYSAPELRLSNSAFADLYHHYRIPCWSTTGSDAHRLDEQAAMEHAVSSLMAALDGANLIHDVGYLGQGLLGNPAALVMCDEISSYVKRIMRGFEMGRGQMALDVIRRVGPGGDYLAERHTVNHFREELWQPWFLNRDNPETWEQKGSLSYVERVTQKTREILKTHQPQPLSEEVTAILEEIASRAEPGLSDVQFTA